MKFCAQGRAGGIAMQLALPFPTPLQPQAASSVWVLASLDVAPARLAGMIMRHRHFFINAGDGSSVIQPGDTLIVRDPQHKLCHVFAPGKGDDVVRIPIAEPDEPVSTDAGPVNRLIAIFLGYDGLGSQYPQADWTRLERLLAALRHKSFDEAPQTRFARSLETRSALGPGADQTLLALLDREGADAARELYDQQSPASTSLDQARELHVRAARQFFSSGLTRHAAHIRRVFRRWSSGDPAPLPFVRSKPRKTPKRVPYRGVRVLAHRVSVPSPLSGRIRDGVHAGTRCKSDLWAVDDATLCAWLAGLDSERIEAWHDWKRIAPDQWALEFALDTQFSVELGLAGRTGVKQDEYLVSVWGDGCDVAPAKVNLRIGKAARLEVRAPADSESAVDIQFLDRNGHHIRLRMDVPSGESGQGL